MCVIYLFAGLSKLQGPSWWGGEAMWRAFANLEYQSLDMTWLAWHPWLVNIMTHVSVVWEISFCVLIWKPLWRPLVLAGAVAASRGHWTLPGDVDVRLDHAGWLCGVPAQRGGPAARVGLLVRKGPALGPMRFIPRPGRCVVQRGRPAGGAGGIAGGRCRSSGAIVRSDGRHLSVIQRIWAAIPAI